MKEDSILEVKQEVGFFTLERAAIKRLCHCQKTDTNKTTARNSWAIFRRKALKPSRYTLVGLRLPTEMDVRRGL